MRGKRKLKVHWVNGVERERINKGRVGRKEEKKNGPEMGREDKKRSRSK